MLDNEQLDMLFSFRLPNKLTANISIDEGCKKYFHTAMSSFMICVEASRNNNLHEMPNAAIFLLVIISLIKSTSVRVLKFTFTAFMVKNI